MKNLPNFQLAAWTLVLDDESKRKDNTPTHLGKVTWNEMVLPVSVWYDPTERKGKSGGNLPNISIRLDKNKLDRSYYIGPDKEDYAGENIVDNPTLAPRGEWGRIDELEKQFGQLVELLMYREDIAEQEAIAEAEIALAESQAKTAVKQ